MESPKHISTSSTDEIDLFELFAKGVIVIKRNIYTILILLLLGIAGGFAYFQYSDKVYASRMVITSDILTESQTKLLVEDLIKLRSEGNFQALNQKLNIPEEEIYKIIGIEVEPISEKPEETNEPKRIYVKVQATILDNSILPQVQEGLIFYLRNNEFVKTRVEQKRRLYTQMIEKIVLELSDLEKLRSNVAVRQSDKKNSLPYEFDLTKINTTVVELNEEKLKLQSLLENVNGVQILEGFTIFQSPTSPKRSLSLISGAAIGFFLAAFVVTFKSLGSLVKLSEDKIIS